MGYHVTLEKADWDIPETPEVLAALKAMNTKYHNAKRGGNFVDEFWFSWMPADYDKTVSSVKDVFDLLGFDSEIIEGPDHPFVRIRGYDSKRGQEELFVAETAPFVEEGSYMEWSGEEGETWRWDAVDGRMTERDGQTVWGEPRPYSYTHYYSEKDADGKYQTGVRVIDPYATPLHA